MSRSPQVGDIWLDMDPRDQRFVRVIDDGVSKDGFVRIRRVAGGSRNWYHTHACRPTFAKLSRFNGKRGGYQFVEAP